MSQARINPRILNEAGGAQEEKGEMARMSTMIAGIAVGDLVKATLGPKGMDKILLSASGSLDKVTFTNDGATILKSIPIDNPSAKIIVDVSKTQDEEVGDGTTSVAVLSGEYLREAEKLVAIKTHPQTIIRGWRKALDVAKKALMDASFDHAEDATAFREDLLNIARTTLSSKILSAHKDYFAELAVSAVLRLVPKNQGENKTREAPDLSYIQIVKKVGGSLEQSFLEEGFILNKKIGVGQPKRVEKARILLANTALDTDKIKIYAAKVKVDSVEKLAEIESAEREKMRAKMEKILKHDINCFISRQLIYNLPEQIFTEHKVMAIEHADFEGVERLAAVLGAEIASTFDNPEKTKLGTCDVIEEIVIGEDKMIRFSGCAKGEACTIVLRGASKHILDEAERSLHDALCVLQQTVQNTRVVLGGGATEMWMAKAVDELALNTTGKEQLAIEAFARALRQIPTIIADNGGFDSGELVAQLKAQHHNGQKFMGLDMENGIVADMRDLKIYESFKSKMQVIVSSHEAAEMILRVDEIIKAAPRQRGGGHGH